ncbi:MAG TPA: vWA domain-containing protein [Blastocatellia bacterium]|nr:vWA domain-containing protein [Blastocatellia bacterium]
MPNPTINPNMPNQASYTVNNSKDVAIDLSLSNLSDGAEFTLQCPAASAVTLFKDASSLVLDTNTNISTTLAGRTVNTTVGPPGTIIVAIEAGGVVAAEFWRLTISGTLPNQCVITEGANADIARVLADPTVSVVSPGASFLEKKTANLQGTVNYTQVTSGAMGLPALPPLRATWSQDPGPASATPATVNFGPFAPGANPCNTTVLTPSVYTTIALTYRLKAFYDLNSNMVADVGEPFNDATIGFNVTPNNQHMLLVLDRSGSMLGQLGGLDTKWEAARRAAHVWADLFIAFRQGVANGKVGFMIFEATACGWGPASSPIEILNGSTGTVIAAPGNLMSINVPTLNLGSPGSCTPIGDALIKALDKLAAPGVTATPADDRYIVVLMTDGYENSGAIVVDNDTPVPAGATGTFASKSPLPPRDIVFPNTTIYTIGVGQTVQANVLDDLPNPPNITTPPPGGFYRLVTASQDLLSTFAEMLGHAIDAAPIGPTTMPITGLPDPNALYFPLNPNEHRLAVTLMWSNVGDDIKLYFRPQTGGAFTQVAGGGVGIFPGVTINKRGNHGMVVVDLAAALGPTNALGTEWKVEYLSNNAGMSIDTSKLQVIVDLFLKADFSFDQTKYFTGDPIVINCRLRAGGVPVTNAKISVELAGPGEGLGTFLATNAGNYRPTTPGGPDPAHPKLAMLQSILRAKKMGDLPIITPPKIFSDGTNQLWDDGAHQDGAANDGDYANVFTETLKEGTYTFRFFVEGTLPDGSAFNRLITMSKWVDVAVDYGASLFSTADYAGAPAGFIGKEIFFTPLSKNKEYLGPFRSSVVEFKTSAGTFLGDMISHPDGRYSRVLIFKRGEAPVITVLIHGQELQGLTGGGYPVVPEEGCLCRIPIIGPLLCWLLRLFH